MTFLSIPIIFIFGKEEKKGTTPKNDSLDVRDRIRTHDLLVRSQTLYPAELHAHIICIQAKDLAQTTNYIICMPDSFVNYYFYI